MPLLPDDADETISGHFDTVKHHCGEWPDDSPTNDTPEALASWCYVSGYANALNMTARELLDALGLE